MRITSVNSNPAVLSSSISSVDTVRANLEAIAKQHNTSVNDLIDSARAAGAEGLPYQIRTVNLANRLDKLEAAAAHDG